MDGARARAPRHGRLFGPRVGGADAVLVLELATLWAISEPLVDGRWLDTMPRATMPRAAP